MMADLFDFPAYLAMPDRLPRPGDDYRAFAPPAAHPHFMLVFVLADGLMSGFQFSDMERLDYAPASASGDADVLNLRFGNSCPTAVRIEGRNLHELFSYLAEQQTRWLRVLPPGQEIRDAAAPVITHIEIEPLDA